MWVSWLRAAPAPSRAQLAAINRRRAVPTLDGGDFGFNCIRSRRPQTNGRPRRPPC